MSFALTTGGQGTVATAQVVWSFNSQTYNFRSDNNFLSWITTIFEVAEAVTGGLALTNPLVLPNGGDALGYSLNTLNNDSVGGSINLSGASGDGGEGGKILMCAVAGGNAGTINTCSNDNANGGSISTASDENNNGGSISTFGGVNGIGGNINTSNNGGYILTIGGNGHIGGFIKTSSNDDYSGGSVNTSAGANYSGGYIDTSNGGGSIATQGQGSIGLGNSNNNNQTLITGTATNDNKTATFPDASGIIALFVRANPIIAFGVCAGNGAVTASSQTVSGAKIGDAVLITCISDRSTLTAGANSNIIFDGYVTADDTVTVRAHNPHALAITLGALIFEIVVFKH